jgi:hypothetical protein
LNDANAVVHRQNLERLGEIIELAVALGAERLEVAHVQYYGWALRNRALAAFAGSAGDIKRVATMGEALPQGELIGRFAANSVAVAGPGGALTFATVAEAEGERNAIYCRCPHPPR